MTPEFYTLIRWLHVVSGSAWLGEVLVINFVLIPVLSKFTDPSGKNFINSIFLKLFRLASVLALVTILTGAVLLYNFIGFNIASLTERGSWGWSILIGGSLGLVLTIFHFFIENWLAKKLGNTSTGSKEDVDDVHLKLKFIPRIGMIVITLIFLLMLNATHLLFPF